MALSSPDHSASAAISGDAAVPADASATHKQQRSPKPGERPVKTLGRLGPGTVMSLAWIVGLFVLAVAVPYLPIRDPAELGLRTGEVARFEPPNSNAWFGGDSQGKDLFAIVLWGIRPALLIGVLVTAISSTVGTIVGVIAGFARGKVDSCLMALTDTMLAFPGLIALSAVMGTLGKSLWVLIMMMSILGIPPVARIVRGVTLSIAEREYVDAARSMGATTTRIVTREILPNVVLVVGAYAFISFSLVIAAEGALAFVGLSIDSPKTWGTLISEGARVIDDASHIALIPGFILFLTILTFNVVGESLRRLADTRPVFDAKGMTSIVEPPPVPEREPTPSEPLLRIQNLCTSLRTENGTVQAVNGVTLELHSGETLGIVGESGSGKTMLLRSVLGTFPLSAVERTGRVEFQGNELLGAKPEQLQEILGNDIGVVFQNPLSALNPVRSIGSQLGEPMRVHGGLSRGAAKARSIELLELVQIPDATKKLKQYPFQLSGGMRQRVTIAIALANRPQLLLADEPTTALDVTVQNQVLTLLTDLKVSEDMAMLLVTHDLAVVKDTTDRVAVMYGGQVVETAKTADLFTGPRMRYTEALLRSIPRLDQPGHTTLAVIPGSPPSLLDPPDGCRFAARCEFATTKCHATSPPLTRAGPDHWYTCWHPAGSDLLDLSTGAGGLDSQVTPVPPIAPSSQEAPPTQVVPRTQVER